MSGGYSLNMDADLLIKEVYLRRPLWDRTNKQHGNRVLVNRLWEEVAQVVGAPKEAVKYKWRGLRATFRTELTKVPEGRENDTSLHPDDYLTSWCFFKPLFFLRGHVSYRRKVVRTPTEVDEDLSEEESETRYGEYSDVKPSANSNNSEPTFIELDSSPTMSPSTAQTSNGLHHFENMNQNYTSTPNYMTSSVKRNFEGEVEYPAKRPAVVEYGRVEQADDDNYFFMSLLPYVKSIPVGRKMFLRLKIQELVWKEINNMEI